MKYISFKKYNWTYIFIIMLLQSTPLTAKEPLCKKVIIQYVDFDILTIADVSCLYFNIAFDKEIQTSTITNNRKIEELIGLLNKLEIDQETKSVDVRMKIRLLYKNTTEEICLDKFNVLRGKNFYKTNASLLQFLKKQVKL